MMLWVFLGGLAMQVVLQSVMDRGILSLGTFAIEKLINPVTNLWSKARGQLPRELGLEHRFRYAIATNAPVRLVWNVLTGGVILKISAGEGLWANLIFLGGGMTYEAIFWVFFRKKWMKAYHDQIENGENIRERAKKRAWRIAYEASKGKGLSRVQIQEVADHIWSIHGPSIEVEIQKELNSRQSGLREAKARAAEAAGKGLV